MSIGKIGEFDMKKGAWNSYIERLEMFFVANNVKDELKLPTLITCMGDEAYELLVNLASPNRPADLSFATVVNLLRQHLSPNPSALAERYSFRQRRQNSTENINAFVAELKKLSRFCKFGNSLDANLRDQFVCGVKNDLVRERLFAENDEITFQKAVGIAVSLETAEKDAAKVNSGRVETSSSSVLNAIGSSAEVQRRFVKPRTRESVSKDAHKPVRECNREGSGAGCTVSAQRNLLDICSGCGLYGHHITSCRYRNFVCSKCRQRGHLRRSCPNLQKFPAGRYRRGKEVHFGQADDESDEDSEETQFFNQLSLNDYKAVRLPVCVDGITLNMEIDTGTAISCISKDTYDKYFSHIELQSDNTILKFYDGSKIKPTGVIRAMVSCQDKSKCLDLFVISGGTTSLIGRKWLSELDIDIPKFRYHHNINIKNCIHTDLNINIDDLLNRFKELFNGQLGRYTGGKVTLRVREGALPVFHRARPVPYALRDRIEEALDAMLRDGIIEPVEFSDWATPLVPVNKPDGSLRICADYKATLNPVLLVDRYPLPKINDILVALNGSQYFSKLDLSQAYNQIELDESKMYTVINTHKGLYKYNRLVFGLASSPGIFQRIMNKVLQGIPNVQVFLDDVIIGGVTKQEHLKTLQAVFERILQSGLKLKKSKCIFFVKEISYLGYIVSKDGVKVDPAKIEAINKMQRPNNVSELRSFLGMVNFFAKFIRNFSARLVPLFNLLRVKAEWKWDEECERTFLDFKRLLISTKVLAHYDPNKTLILTCDASARGIGGVLSQPGVDGERPIAYVSRTLNSAEKNYSQIHREALAIIFCVTKFHQYLYGRHFTLRTDHKPLVSIFGPNKGIPSMAASRMIRWAIILSAYNYDIEYVKTSENSADGLSRLPIDGNMQETIPEQTFLHFAQDALLLDYNEIKKQTQKDTTLARVLSYVRDGWPENWEIAETKPFFSRKSELYEELGCLMWGHRLVIPLSCREKVMQLIHEPHMGIVKSKALARSYVWWPGIDEAVEAVCRNCVTCAVYADAPPRHTPQVWPWYSRPWIRIHLDFLGPIFGKLYLVIIDSSSKWIETFCVPSTAAKITITKLKELWSRWGIPKQVVTDNGPPFTSEDFSTFLKSYGTEHIRIAPYHPSSNGAAENAVKTLKRVINKAHKEGQIIEDAINNFLLYYRNVEHASTGECPATLMIGRRVRTRLDVLKPDREGCVRKAQQHQSKAVGGRDRSFHQGDEIWYRQYHKSDRWLPGKIDTVLGSTDYKVVDSDGQLVHRHVDQIRSRRKSSLVFPSGSVQQPESVSLNTEPQSGTSTRTLEAPMGVAVSGTSHTPPILSGIENNLAVASPKSVPVQTRPVRACRLKKSPVYK